MNKRNIHGSWSSRWTFILAATGSAVGLGNIWKFPYITGANGGGAFVLIYLLAIASIGIPIMMAETLIGRRGRHSPVNTMRELTMEAGGHRAWVGIGAMGIAAGLLILSYYSVIAGWALHYIFEVGSGKFINAAGDTVVASFETLQANKREMVKWHTLFMMMTLAVIVAGVTKGLGLAVRIMMPLLFMLLIVLAVYGSVEGNFQEGFKFLFNFKFDQLSWHAVLVALGHAFFTLSIGMGAIMAFGSYMPANASIGKAIMTVAVLDTFIALTAGMAIFPLVFAHDALEVAAGPSLMFITLPVAFGNIAGGDMFGALFFVLVTLAAWSSAISLVEPGVAWLVETEKFSRLGASLLLGAVAWTLGLGTVLSFNDWAGPEYQIFNMTVFEFLDALTSNIMLPLGGMFIAIFAGWVMHRDHLRRELQQESLIAFNVWHFMVRYVSPVLVAIVFVSLVGEMIFS